MWNELIVEYTCIREVEYQQSHQVECWVRVPAPVTSKEESDEVWVKIARVQGRQERVFTTSKDMHEQ